MGLDRVELRPAFVWDCPECGREHFARTIVLEMSEEERAELCQAYGVEPGAEGDYMTMPAQVFCDHCQLTFPTQYSPDDEPDSD